MKRRDRKEKDKKKKKKLAPGESRFDEDFEKSKAPAESGFSGRDSQRGGARGDRGRGF